VAWRMGRSPSQLFQGRPPSRTRRGVLASLGRG
jgi:hypothetical protein